MDQVFVQVMLVAALAGFIQGLSGFAFALVATSLWTWTLEPQLLVPTVVLTSLLGQVTSIVSVKTEITLSRATPFLTGGAVGVPLGVLILPMLNTTMFRLSIGIILLVYCSVMLSGKRLPLVASGGKVADGCVGVLAGAMGGATGISGPPLIVWCALRGWSKEVQRATFQSFFIGTQILTIGIYIARGLINASSLQLALIAAVPIILSSWLGSRLFKRFTGPQFQKMIFGLLFVSGLVLVLNSL